MADKKGGENDWGAKPLEDPGNDFDFQPDHNTAVLNRAFDEVLNGHDLDLVPELYDEDCCGYDPANGTEIHGRNGLIELLEGYRSIFPQHKYQTYETVAEGSMVCIRWSVAMNSSDFRDDFVTHGMSMCQFRNGKIWKVWQHWDNLGLLQEIGAVSRELNIAESLSSLR